MTKSEQIKMLPTSVNDADHKFNRNHCSTDCPDRSGKTRVLPYKEML